MANNKNGTNATNAPALPALDAIETVALDTLPQPKAKTSALTKDETALALAIFNAADGTNGARGPVIDGRDAATSAAARIKRLMRRYVKTLDTAPTVTVDGNAVPAIFTSRVVADGKGFRWVILRSPAPAETPAAEPAAATA